MGRADGGAFLANFLKFGPKMFGPKIHFRQAKKVLPKFQEIGGGGWGVGEGEEAFLANFLKSRNKIISRSSLYSSRNQPGTC